MFPSSSFEMLQNHRPGALQKPSPYPTHRAVNPIQEPPVFPLQRNPGALSPLSSLSGRLSPCSTSHRQLGPAQAAGAWWPRDMALPDIMGRLVPAPASARARFQHLLQGRDWTISCAANINLPGRAAGPGAPSRHRATCSKIIVQLCL